MFILSHHPALAFRAQLIAMRRPSASDREADGGSKQPESRRELSWKGLNVKKNPVLVHPGTLDSEEQPAGGVQGSTTCSNPALAIAMSTAQADKAIR